MHLNNKFVREIVKKLGQAKRNNNSPSSLFSNASINVKYQFLRELSIHVKHQFPRELSISNLNTEFNIIGLNLRTDLIFQYYAKNQWDTQSHIYT